LFACETVLPACRLTIGLHALFGCSARLVIETTDSVHVERIEVRAHLVDVDPVIAQVVGTRAGHPPAIAAVAAVVVPHRVRVGVVPIDVAVVRVVAMQVVRCQVWEADEVPRIRWDVVIELVVAHRRPADVVVRRAPLHPRRPPRRVGTPHPRASPDPATVVVGCPAEWVERVPHPAEVREGPVAVRVRRVVRNARDEHVAVDRVVVPRAVRRELIIEVRLIGDWTARRYRRDVRVRRTDVRVVVVVVVVSVVVVVVVVALRARDAGASGEQQSRDDEKRAHEHLR
jgi:hypothetical protein